MSFNRFYLFAFLIAFSCQKDEEEKPNTLFDISDSLEHDGKTRTYKVHLPPMYYERTEDLPVLLGFHGGGGSSDNFEAQSELNEKADSENFIVVYPDGLANPGLLGFQTWNAGKCCGMNSEDLNTDDVGFVSKLIDLLSTTYRIDEKRIYATGHSNGAMMCYRLSNELSGKIAAIAPNAGNMQVESAYTPSRNVPVLNIISKLDESVRYAGGFSSGISGHYNPPTDSCLNVVAARAGCEVAKELKETFPLYTIYSWNTCNEDTFEVLLYLLEDGGHSWPGGNKGYANADEPSEAFDNNDVIWEFLKKYSLP
jgi:polyhydroxybutyrate depolymerase